MTFPDGFDPQPRLTSERLSLSPLTQADHEGVFQAASDPQIWAGHPAKDRYQPEVFRGYFAMLLESGTTLLVRDVATGQAIGCSRYYPEPSAARSVSIGFTFLSRAYWGGVWNFEMKRLMLDHAYGWVDTIWFHIDPKNLRSQRATQKLGAVFMREEIRDLGGSPAPWCVYRLDQAAWAKTKNART